MTTYATQAIQTTRAIAARLSEVTGNTIEVYTAPKADSLLIWAATQLEAFEAVGKLAKVLERSTVDVIEHGDDDDGHYYRVAI